MAVTQHMTAKTLGELFPTRVLPVVVGQKLVNRLVLDSRQVQAGDTFLAVPGMAQDGRKYIPAAVNQGATLVIAEAHSVELELLFVRGIPVLYVPGLSAQLSQIAANLYGLPSSELLMMGVTGTNGKTTIAYWFAKIAEQCGLPAGLIGTLGAGLITGHLQETGMTTPDAIRVQECLAECLHAGVKTVAMEVSSHALDQGRVAAVQFDIAVFTNLTRDHLDYHGDVDAYRRAKMKLMAMPTVKTAIINNDDPAAEHVVYAAINAETVWRYSVQDSAADFYCTALRYTNSGVTASISTPSGVFELAAPIVGAFNVSNLLAVIASCCAAGLSMDDVINAVASLPAVPGRMQRIDVDADITVVVDYAHTPDALENVLMAARRHCTGKLWCVFGCGGNRDIGKRPLMGHVAETLADQLVLTSDNPRQEDPAQILQQIRQGVSDTCLKIAVIEDRAEAIQYAIKQAVAGDWILLAGKGHESFQQFAEHKVAFNDADVATIALRQRMGGVQ